LGLLQSQLGESLLIIQTAIKNILSDERAQWILSSHLEAQSEWALSFKADTEIKKYIIDRTFIDENNIRWIIDYKISAPEENEDLLAFLNAQKDRYESQLNQYAEILKAQDNRKIKLGLYFPLCKGWIAWEYVYSVYPIPTNTVKSPSEI
jgi:ATP-dependent exoDNAse (exonuclease V) beta subunit